MSLIFDEEQIQRHTRLCCWTFLGGVCGVLATLAFLQWGPVLGEDSLTFAGLILVCSFCLAVVALFAGVVPILTRYAHRKLSGYSERKDES